jgi:hypothetical protein
MAALSHWFQWRDALVVVKPETLIVGIARDSDCCGAENPDPLGALEFPKSCND